jgi:hypothetical protein
METEGRDRDEVTCRKKRHQDNLTATSRKSDRVRNVSELFCKQFRIHSDCFCCVYAKCFLADHINFILLDGPSTQSR